MRAVTRTHPPVRSRAYAMSHHPHAQIAPHQPVPARRKTFSPRLTLLRRSPPGDARHRGAHRGHASGVLVSPVDRAVEAVPFVVRIRADALRQPPHLARGRQLVLDQTRFAMQPSETDKALGDDGVACVERGVTYLTSLDYGGSTIFDRPLTADERDCNGMCGPYCTQLTPSACGRSIAWSTTLAAARRMRTPAGRRSTPAATNTSRPKPTSCAASTRFSAIAGDDARHTPGARRVTTSARVGE